MIDTVSRHVCDGRTASGDPDFIVQQSCDVSRLATAEETACVGHPQSTVVRVAAFQ